MAQDFINIIGSTGVVLAPYGHQSLVLKSKFLWRDIMLDGKTCASVFQFILCKFVPLAREGGPDIRRHATSL